jgi:LmbE family N-acetylglucosaminyl deacetylase
MPESERVISVVESSKPTLLAVFAHPDDESFGPGGTLALYARRGCQVHLICATAGEAGTPQNGAHFEHTALADLRAAELRCAAEKLGLRQVHFLGYRDSGMEGSPENRHPQALIMAPVDQVAGEVAHLIRQIKPQVVITFDPIGGYRHPDHIAIHRATVLAFEMAGQPESGQAALAAFRPQKLYFHTMPRRWLRAALWLLPLLGRDPHHFGANRDIDLADFANVDFPIHARINCRSVANLKAEASACHASQGGAIGGGALRGLMWLVDGGEDFMRAIPPAPPRLRERDLFDGVSLSG